MLAPFRILLASAYLAAAALAHAESCTSPVAGCTEWLSLGPGRIMFYRNHPIAERNERIAQATVVIHGQGRDADNYYRHAIAAAFLADALEKAIIVTPKFASSDATCKDKLAADEINWRCLGPQRWTSGGSALGHGDVTSYDAMDEILRRLADRRVFPNLRSIVLVGHSAGGQYVTRYEMANTVHEKLGVPVHYIVANPSAYTYPASVRPTAQALPANVAALPPGYVAPLAAGVKAFVEFADANNCTTYDQWPYGMQKRVGYTAALTDEDLKRQLSSRPVTYLLGELDILPLYGFDGSCAAMAQGPTRLARGLAYHRFVNETLSANHKVMIVPACGHNARCMFGSEASLPLLFPRD